MFAIEHGNMHFVFPDEKSLIDWFAFLFHNTINKNDTYRELMTTNVDRILDRCFKNAPEKSITPILRSLDCLQNIYGSLYDPSGALFIIQRRIS